MEKYFVTSAPGFKPETPAQKEVYKMKDLYDGLLVTRPKKEIINDIKNEISQINKDFKNCDNLVFGIYEIRPGEIQVNIDLVLYISIYKVKN